MEAIGKEKGQEKMERQREEEAHGAGEPVWKLKRNAHLARKRLREGERLKRKIGNGDITYHWLSQQEQQLLDRLDSGKLHQYVECANAKYGHGIARTNDSGFRQGENTNHHVPIEVRAHLHILQGH